MASNHTIFALPCKSHFFAFFAICFTSRSSCSLSFRLSVGLHYHPESPCSLRKLVRVFGRVPVGFIPPDFSRLYSSDERAPAKSTLRGGFFLELASC